MFINFQNLLRIEHFVKLLSFKFDFELMVRKSLLAHTIAHICQ
jgi:hypothetical protein